MICENENDPSRTRTQDVWIGTLVRYHCATGASMGVNLLKGVNHSHLNNWHRIVQHSLVQFTNETQHLNNN